MEKSLALRQSEMLLRGAKNSMIDDIVVYLKKYTSQLDNNYPWKSKFVGVEKFLDKSDFEKFDKIDDSFEKTIELKKILSDKLLFYYQNDNNKFKELSLWIIQKWGRISKGDNEKLHKLISEFVETKGQSNFERISSKSKVLGFMYPQDFIIYDSRIAYAMNMVLLLSYSSASVQRFFPIPDSLNTKLKELDIYSIIRYKHTRSYNKMERKKVVRHYFLPEEDAYLELNNLVKDINQKLWDNEFAYRKNEPFYTQMLLFTLADTIILDDLKELFKEYLQQTPNR